MIFEKLNLNAACREQHKAAIEKGFVPQLVSTDLMLIVSELGEACEADRKAKHANITGFDEELERAYKECTNAKDIETSLKSAFELHIKDTFEDEIADAFLRLMDLCGSMNIDIEKHIRLKAVYNKLRPPKHGKLY